MPLLLGLFDAGGWRRLRYSLNRRIRRSNRRYRCDDAYHERSNREAKLPRLATLIFDIVATGSPRIFYRRIEQLDEDGFLLFDHNFPKWLRYFVDGFSKLAQ